MVSAASWKRIETLTDGFYVFENKAVDYINKIINKTGASIVLTTTHRFKYSTSEWVEIFKNRGINASIEKIDDKKTYEELNSKYLDIITWINSNKNEKIIIIDDDSSLNELPEDIKKLCVFTKPLVGLNDENYNQIINILLENGE